MTSVADHSPGNRKSHSREWLFFTLLCLLLSGCTGERTAVKLAGASMGTTWHVTYVAGSARVDEGQLQAVLDRVEDSMSTWREDSEISRFNRTPPGQWFELSADFFAVLEAALQVGQASGGAYDVTVAPLVDLWGFGPHRAEPRVPLPEQLQQTLSRVGQAAIELDAAGRRVRKTAPRQLDFSSIAKGYAVDALASHLAAQHIEDFLVEVGGEMSLSGDSARGDAWRIAIEQPDPMGRSVAQAIALTDRAVATSGDYRNFFELEGVRYSHSIDPRSGKPVAHDLVSVTVVDDSAMLADAWATALTVMGAEAAQAVAQAHGLAVYFIRRQGDEFHASHTPAFAPYLQAQR